MPGNIFFRFPKEERTRFGGTEPRSVGSFTTPDKDPFLASRIWVGGPETKLDDSMHGAQIILHLYCFVKDTPSPLW